MCPICSRWAAAPAQCSFIAAHCLSSWTAVVNRRACLGTGNSERQVTDERKCTLGGAGLPSAAIAPVSLPATSRTLASVMSPPEHSPKSAHRRKSMTTLARAPHGGANIEREKRVGLDHDADLDLLVARADAPPTRSYLIAGRDRSARSCQLAATQIGREEPLAKPSLRPRFEMTTH
jgi:hypothetical protein